MAHETIVADAPESDDIAERFLNARDERIEALTLAMFDRVGESLGKSERTVAIKAMLSRASREAFDILVAEYAAAEAVASGVCEPAPAPAPWHDTFDQWEQPNGAH